MAEQDATTEQQPQDVAARWSGLDGALRSRAMRLLHEEQQRTVVELGRQIMEKEVEIAVALTKARAAEELNLPERKAAILADELAPREKDLVELRRKGREERELLDAYERLGKGI